MPPGEPVVVPPYVPPEVPPDDPTVPPYVPPEVPPDDPTVPPYVPPEVPPDDPTVPPYVPPEVPPEPPPRVPDERTEDPTRIPSELPAPTGDLRGDLRRDDDERVANDPTARSRRRLRNPDDADAPEDSPKAAPRPPGTYPREIAHRERVEYSFDPSTGDYSASIVESSEPVVTNWDDSPPASDQRSVGGWDVVPGQDGVVADRNEGEIPIPEGIKQRLALQAEKEGGVATTTDTLDYHHDLDTRDTQAKPVRPSRARVQEAMRASRAGEPGAGVTGAGVTGAGVTGAGVKGAGEGGLNDKYAKLREMQQQQQKAPKPAAPAQRNRRRGSGREDKKGGYNLPEIVIVQEPALKRGPLGF